MDKSKIEINQPNITNSGFSVNLQIEKQQQSQKNVINSIMSFLPDNRPITALQIVEYPEKCPKNFICIYRTYDQDADADLWRENNILFGRQASRYLCLSKTEGLPDYVLETLMITPEKKAPPKGFSLLSRTADSEQRAWRKRQLSYKLSKRSAVSQAITDIILCSKLKTAPEGFKMIGYINGMLVCYKSCIIPSRPPPPIPNTKSLFIPPTSFSENNIIEKGINCLSIEASKTNNKLTVEEHDYEEIATSHLVKSPKRPAPQPPMFRNSYCYKKNEHNVKKATVLQNLNTLGSHGDLDGVPFIINPVLLPSYQNQSTLLPQVSDFMLNSNFDYDFQLERQTLCTMKSASSKNPFFK